MGKTWQEDNYEEWQGDNISRVCDSGRRRCMWDEKFECHFKVFTLLFNLLLKHKRKRGAEALLSVSLSLGCCEEVGCRRVMIKLSIKCNSLKGKKISFQIRRRFFFLLRARNWRGKCSFASCNSKNAFWVYSSETCHIYFSRSWLCQKRNDLSNCLRKNDVTNCKQIRIFLFSSNDFHKLREDPLCVSWREKILHVKSVCLWL